jgi:hypothetical protein
VVARNWIIDPTLAPIVLNPGWGLGAVGDLNGDGHRDLVWQHAPSTGLSGWLMTHSAHTPSRVHGEDEISPALEISDTPSIHLEGPLPDLRIGAMYDVIAVRTVDDGLWFMLHTVEDSAYPHPYPVEMRDHRPARWAGLDHRRLCRITDSGDSRRGATGMDSGRCVL